MSSAAISQNFSIIAKSVRFAGMQFGNAKVRAATSATLSTSTQLSLAPKHNDEVPHLLLLFCHHNLVDSA
jgi:hypothetical protein